MPQQSNTGRPAIDAATLRRLAVEADCDPRTILAAYKGEPGRGPARERALAALVKAGFMNGASK